MARKKSVNLTDAELRLMEVVWQRGPSTVADVAETVPQLAYSTVLTTLRILEEKGYLTHTKEGRAFVYAPVVDRAEASRSAVRHLVNRFFGNRADLLVLNMIEDEAITSDELDRLKKLISEEKEA
jgi:predicted transcriptional regulator